MYKILLVDDDYAIKLLYQSELEDEGYSVTTTSGYLNLLDQIRHLRPDLIILEIKLRELNVLKILQEIRNQYYDLPVILCSAYPSFRYDIKSAADSYVTKSIDLSELKFKIKMAFESIGKRPKNHKAGFPKQYSSDPSESSTVFLS